jgi:thiamine transporter ThiT
MAEFGENGYVQPSAPQPGYTVETKAKIKRVGLASFLCGIGACFSVALIGVILLFLAFQISDLFGTDAGIVFGESGFRQGMGMAVLMSAMNWYFGYFTVPAAAIVLALSLGRFPRRGITRAAPYYRWGAIWGAVLVGSTTGIASYFIPTEARAATALSAFLTGAAIGATAGLICGAIFRGIVRPAEQVRPIRVDVF